MKYKVVIPEVHYSHRIVEARSAEEAERKVRDGDDCDELYLEYSHTLDDKSWDTCEYNPAEFLEKI